MSNYGFKLQFELPAFTYIGCECKSIEIELLDYTVTLSSRSSNNINKSTHLLLKGEGFSSEKEALYCGYKIRTALLWSGTKLGIGFDLGKDNIKSGASKSLKDQIKRDLGITLLDSIHGLSIYNADEHTKTLEVDANLSLTKSFDLFLSSLKEGYDMNLNFDERLILSFELFGLSQFESSDRAKFLTLMTAIEVVSSQDPREQNAQNLIDGFIKETDDSNLTTNEKKSLKSALGYLKRISIRRSGLNLVLKYIISNRYFDKSSTNFYDDCYGIRNELAHYGKTDSNLGVVTRELESMVSDLLIAIGSNDI